MILRKYKYLKKYIFLAFFVSSELLRMHLVKIGLKADTAGGQIKLSIHICQFYFL